MLYAREQEEDKDLFMRWIPYQSTISFAEFKHSLHSAAHPKSEKQILNDVEDIMTAFDKQRGMKEVI